MNIVELVLSVCLAADPSVCRDERLQFLEEGALVGCMVRAQPTIAEWQATHPRWTVKRWVCAQPRRDRDA